jgi:hypothetical protein
VRHKLLISFVAISVVITVLVAGAGAQAVSLKEQLDAQYKYAKLGQDSSGYSVVQEGTLLAVQKGGIKGVPSSSTITRSATFQDGTVHAAADPAGNSSAQKVGKLLCGLHKCPTAPDAVNDEKTTKFFKVGDKVYPTKIEVNLAKDQVIMGIVACDTCNKTDPPTYNKANVIFQFAQASLAKASAGDVEDTIGQLLSISTDDQKAQDAQQDQQPAADAVPAAAAAPAAQAEPQSIEKGMTPEQVEAALGKPQKKVTIGTKQLYIYQDMKVTFINGKVSDVQ